MTREYLFIMLKITLNVMIITVQKHVLVIGY